MHVLQETIQTSYAQFSTGNALWGPYGLGVWGLCLFGGFSVDYPPPCRHAERFSHPGKYGYLGVISRRDRFWFSLMPSYYCDDANAWCEIGHPPGPNDAPGLSPYAVRYLDSIESYMTDVFAGSALALAGV